MSDIYEFPFLMDDCPSALFEYSENDKELNVKIQKAESIEELSSIISDELVRSIREQLQLK